MIDTPLYNPAIHHRRSIRLQGYDYSQAGAYFITICTHNRECLFGAVVGAGSKPALCSKPALGSGAQDRAGLEPAPTQPSQMVLNNFGEIVKNTWADLPNHIAGIESDEFVIMPNHFHGIVVIIGAGIEHRAVLEPAPTRGDASLPEIVRQMKTFSARRINKIRGTQGLPVWQRNYWEHIIRNETELNRIRQYIHDNPAQWESDKLHPCRDKNFFAPMEIREPAADYGIEVWMV